MPLTKAPRRRPGHLEVFQGRGTKQKNMQDATLLNIRALKKQLAALTIRVSKLERRK
jgi:hypothetical protein